MLSPITNVVIILYFMMMVYSHENFSAPCRFSEFDSICDSVNFRCSHKIYSLRFKWSVKTVSSRANIVCGRNEEYAFIQKELQNVNWKLCVSQKNLLFSVNGLYNFWKLVKTNHICNIKYLWCCIKIILKISIDIEY